MTSEILDFSKEGITFLLPTNDVLNNSDVDLQWQKRLDLVKDTIETRLDIFKQRKGEVMFTDLNDFFLLLTNDIFLV